MIHRIRHWLAERLYQIAGRIEPRRPDLHEHVDGSEFVGLQGWPNNPVLVLKDGGVGSMTKVVHIAGDGYAGTIVPPAGHVGG